MLLQNVPNGLLLSYRSWFRSPGRVPSAARWACRCRGKAPSARGPNFVVRRTSASCNLTVGSGNADKQRRDDRAVGKLRRRVRRAAQRAFAGHLSQLLSPFRRIDAKIKKLSRGVTSRLGVLYRDVRIAAEGEHLLPPLKPIAVLLESATVRRYEDVEALAKGHPTRIANDALPGGGSPDARWGGPVTA